MNSDQSPAAAGLDDPEQFVSGDAVASPLSFPGVLLRMPLEVDHQQRVQCAEGGNDETNAYPGKGIGYAGRIGA